MALVPRAASLLEAPREERAPVIYKHWDAMAKVKVFDFGGAYRGINIDNVANSPLIPFDGNFEDPELEEAEWGIDVSYLIGLFDHCTFLSLGAGGGGDVLQALVEGAAEVHAVEVNPHINRMLLDGDPGGYLEPPIMNVRVPEGREPPPVPVLRDEEGELITSDRYSGHIYRDPRVRVVSEDARTYVRRHAGPLRPHLLPQLEHLGRPRLRLLRLRRELPLHEGGVSATTGGPSATRASSRWSTRSTCRAW